MITCYLDGLGDPTTFDHGGKPFVGRVLFMDPHRKFASTALAQLQC